MSDARRKTAMVAIVMMATLMVTFGATPGQAQHGGPVTNTHNDLVVVQGDAENPDGLEARYGSVMVLETISFANDDPNRTTDYGIVYITPQATIDSDAIRVLAYSWDYVVANYTLMLYNVTDDWWGNLTGQTSDVVTIQPGDLGPDDPGADHPKANATYFWWAKVVNAQGHDIMEVGGGELTTNVTGPTVVDMSSLDLPPLGESSYVAEGTDLIDLTYRLSLTVHEDLSEGFYRVRIDDATFEYGVKFTIQVGYSVLKDDEGIVIDKLLFTQRVVHVDAYHNQGMEVVMYDAQGGEGNKVPPTEASTGPGVPTKFTTDTTFSLVIQEEGADETDWGLYGRYALLVLLIGALMVLVLWGGPRRKGEDGAHDEAGEEAGEDDEMEARRLELEVEKGSILEAISDLDRRHEAGELGEGVWKRKRASLKAKAVVVMRELEGLKEGKEG